MAIELRRFIPFPGKSKGQFEQEPKMPAQELSRTRDAFGSLPTAGVIFDSRPPEQQCDEAFVERNRIK